MWFHFIHFRLWKITPQTDSMFSIVAILVWILKRVSLQLPQVHFTIPPLWLLSREAILLRLNYFQNTLWPSTFNSQCRTLIAYYLSHRVMIVIAFSSSPDNNFRSILCEPEGHDKSCWWTKHCHSMFFYYSLLGPDPFQKQILAFLYVLSN